MPLIEKQTGIKKERATLLQRLRTVESQLTSVEQQIKSKQEVLNEKSSVLKAAEIIQLQGNTVEIIRLTEQICGMNQKHNLKYFLQLHIDVQ